MILSLIKANHDQSKHLYEFKMNLDCIVQSHTVNTVPHIKIRLRNGTRSSLTSLARSGGGHGH